MARDKLTEYSATASENTVCGDVNIAENSALPSDMNNYAREIMTHLKNFSDGTDAIDALTVTGDLTVDTNTLHVDSANNRVGVRTTSPADHLAVVASGANAHISVDRSDGATGRTVLMHSSSGGQLQTTGSVPLIFGTADTERGRFLSGGGLTFNGDTAAANALDDYEEGTWTPTVTTSTSVDISSSGLGATYTKIGRMVNVQSYMSWTNNQNNNSDQFYIGGLPFAVGYHYGGWTIAYVGSANMNDALGVFNIGDTKMYFHQNDGAAPSLTNSDITSRGFTTLILSGTYYV